MDTVDAKTLKSVKIFEDMPQAMLEEVAELCEIVECEADTVLFRQKQKLDYFYLVLEGGILLQLEPIAGEEPLKLGIVTSGYSCGISTFIPGTKSSSSGICAEKSRLVRIKGTRMLDLFESDGKLGYTFMVKVMRIFKTRLNQRTRLFLRSLERHPEIQAAFQDLGHMSYG
jgi:CRP-like cAMP-binding protein